MWKTKPAVDSQPHQCARGKASAPRCSRRSRTAFTPDQLGMLQAVLETSRCPDWSPVKELAPELHLDAYVTKCCVLRDRAPRTPGLKISMPSKKTAAKGPAPPAQRVHTSASSSSTSTASAKAAANRLGAQRTRAGRAGSRGLPGTGSEASEDPLPADLHNIHLDSSAPWALLPHDVGELVRMYSLFEDEEPDDLAEYLYPQA
ncbi:paired-like homeodomain transcription factor LEUTX [Oryctolagus cuniculus]|uniref:paired-like homeodomain transcription factor LEUTX n=1 Tax=Oryctolagus cuniculus TaxID=9986 RepID=UPI00387907E0